VSHHKRPNLAPVFELSKPNVLLDQKLLQTFIVSPLLRQQICLELLARTKATSQCLRIKGEYQD